MRTIAERAEEVFERAVLSIQADNKLMLAEHSSKGLLRSGKTIREAVQAFETRSLEAVEAACESASKKIESRGRKWKAAIGSIRSVMNRHFDNAFLVIGSTIRVGSDGAEALASPLLEKARTAVLARLSEWEEGWAGDRGKPWRERNPALWWGFTVLISALLGFAFAVAKDQLDARNSNRVEHVNHVVPAKPLSPAASSVASLALPKDKKGESPQ